MVCQIKFNCYGLLVSDKLGIWTAPDDFITSERDLLTSPLHQAIVVTYHNSGTTCGIELKLETSNIVVSCASEP